MSDDNRIHFENNTIYKKKQCSQIISIKIKFLVELKKKWNKFEQNILMTLYVLVCTSVICSKCMHDWLN